MLPHSAAQTVAARQPGAHLARRPAVAQRSGRLPCQSPSSSSSSNNNNNNNNSNSSSSRECPAHRGTRRRQRRRAAPAACASEHRPAANPKPSKHFLRPSLLATGMTEPADVLQHALALFRKADLPGLAQYLPDSYTGDSVAQLSLPRQPWLCLAEHGPLARLAGVLDVGARRVLPGHLLRRSQVLSTLRPSPDLFQQRTALTARSGECSVFIWVLRFEEEAGSSSGSHGGSSSAGSGGSDASSSGSNSRMAAAGERGGRWVIESVRREDASADMPLPTTPHPQAAPEAVCQAQLAALKAGDVFEASCFCMRPGGKHLSSRRTSLVAHHDALRSQLQQEPYRVLLNHAGAQLGPAALPTQRDMLQEVAVLSPDGASARYVWRLKLNTNNCWMVQDISAVGEQGQQEQQGEQD